MRKVCKWWLLTAVLLVGAGCSDDDDGAEVKLAFSKRAAVFSAKGGDVVINVAAAGAWSVAQPEVSWLNVSSDEHSIQMHAQANPAPEVRRAEVVVLTDGYEAAIEVTQEPAVAVELEVNGPDSYTFDSEGGRLLLSVEANASWNASIDQTWCSLSVDPKGLLTVIVTEPNVGTERLSATLTVTAGDEVNGARKTVALTQQMRSENPYFKVADDYQIEAGSWMLAGVDQGAGMRASCTIAEASYNEYFNMSRLSFDGLSNPLTIEALELSLPYDVENKTVSIPLGQRVATFEEKDMYLYLVALDMVKGRFSTGSGAVEGTLSDDMQTITLAAMPDGYPTLGVVMRKISDTSKNGMLGDIYFPSGDGIILKRAAASSGTTSRVMPFSSVQRGDVVRLQPHTTGIVSEIVRFN